MSNALYPTPIGLTWTIGRSPEFNTVVQRAASGFERRTALMAYPLYNLRLSYEFLRSDSINAELQLVQDFFLARNGKSDNFLLDDSYTPDDSVTDQQFGTGDGVTASFQLQRNLKSGGFGEPVMNVNAMTNVKDGGSVIPPGAGAGKYTINGTGLITFGTVPTAGHLLTWSGTYYLRCRFDLDVIDFENFMYQLWDLKKVQLVGSLGIKV